MKKKVLSVLLLTVFLTGCGSVATLPETSGKGIASENFKDAEVKEQPEDVQTAEKNVTAEGPYGSLTITIPDDWSYEIRGVGDDKLLSADYGICLYPTNVSNGYIEVGYHSAFGVCGTSLETVATTLAGDNAFIDYYGGSKIWSYICFDGNNKGIVAIASEVDDWDKSYLDESIEILDSVIYNADEQSGGIGVYDADSQVEELSLMVSAKKVSSTAATLVFNQYDRSITTELIFGEDFKLEKKEGTEWKEADIVLDGEYGYKDIAHIIKKEDTTEYEYDWEWLYGSLEAGEYRIAVNIIRNFRDTGDSDKYTVYAHFVLR